MSESQVTEVSTDVETEETITPAEPEIIKAENPSKEEMAELLQHLKVNFNFDVNFKPTLFRFKKSKDKETGIVIEREAVELGLPYPSVKGIMTILETGGKQLELLMEAVESVVNAQARELLYEDTKLNASNFPVEKLSWEYIASIPKAQRRGGGIPKETWEEFIADYIAVMPAATGKNVEQVTNAAKLLANKLNSCKTAEPVLQLLVQQLSIYMGASQNSSDYSECVEFLLDKADTFLNMTEEDLTANL